MTETITYCVRGCTRPCNCEDCGVAEQPTHAPLRKEATHGYLCTSCADRLRGWLTDIPDLYATLDPYEPPERDQTPGKKPKLSGSPALVRLDVVALTDRRTIVGDIASRDGHIDGDQGIVNVAAAVAGWALALAEEHNIRGSLRYLTDTCGLLVRWHDELCASPWVDECYDEIRDVITALNRAHGIRQPRPVGRCINIYERDGETVACDATLYAPTEGVKIKCRSCGRRYDGREMLLVKMQAKADEAKRETAS